MSISLCIITKNEEQHLEKFLQHHQPLADEIIIIDTGSTDNTISIAKKFTKKIFTERWEDDFSKARNQSVQKATKDWILWLDPDESIDEKDFETIRNLTKNTKHLGYRFIQETYSKEKKLFSRGICKLFQNKKGIHFTYPIHETVKKSIREKDGTIGSTRISIKHHPRFTKEKFEYYLKLLEEKRKRFPDSNWEKEIELEQSLSTTFK